MKSSRSALVLIPTIILLGALFLTQETSADAAFRCYNKRNGVTANTDFAGYKRCAMDCDCSVFEHMCLERFDEFNFTLNHRSIHAEKRCNPPDCICNSEDNFVDQSYYILKRQK